MIRLGVLYSVSVPLSVPLLLHAYIFYLVLLAFYLLNKRSIFMEAKHA